MADDRGPVLVKIEYRIDPKDRDRFLRAIDELGEQRRRDGAFAWGVFEDMAEFGRFEEAYLIEFVARAHALPRAGHQRGPRGSRTRSATC